MERQVGRLGRFIYDYVLDVFMKYIMLILLLSLSVLAIDQPAPPELDGTLVKDNSISLDDLDGVKDTLNSIAMPGFVVGLFGNDRINLEVTRADFSVAFLGIVTADGKITEIQDSFLDEPTLNVFTTEQTMEDVFSAGDPFGVLSDALDSGDISYEAVTFGNKVKLGFGRVFIKIIGWFR